MSDSVRPHRWQPTRLPHPWDSPVKNTRVGCHFLLQCMKVKSESEVSQLCPTLRDPMDCSLPGCSVHGIFQARVLASQIICQSFIIIPKRKTRFKQIIGFSQVDKTCKRHKQDWNLEAFNFKSSEMSTVLHHQKNCLYGGIMHYLELQSKVIWAQQWLPQTS